MNDQPIVRAVLGMRGYGKTTLARQLVADAARMIGHDPRREYDALALPWVDFVAYVDRMGWERFRVTCRDAAADHAEEWCATVWALGELMNPDDTAHPKRVMVLMEEADMIARPGQEPSIFKQLVSQGRHVGLDVLAVSRRPAEVSRFLTSQADELYVFRTQEPKDLAYLADFIGKEAAARVQQLQRFEYVKWTPEGGASTHLAVRG